MPNFVDDDQGYLAWLAAHPEGHVLNAHRSPTSGYLVVHSARCAHISRSTAPAGHWTTGAYRKICAEDLDSLRAIARQTGRLDGSFSKTCAHCRG